MNVASVWLSLGMAVVRLSAALLYRHYSIGAVGAVGATIAERKRPGLGVWWDNNAQVVAVSLITMVTLTVVLARFGPTIFSPAPQTLRPSAQTHLNRDLRHSISDFRYSENQPD